MKAKIRVFLLFFVVAIGGAFLAGCALEGAIERVQPEYGPKTKQLPSAYETIKLRQSSSVDVLESIQQHEGELTSQSESVVASYGEKKKTYQYWLTMAAFDEEDFKVTRKYFLAVDEKPWHLGAKGQKLRFDSRMVFDKEFLSEPYTSENAKRIAIIEKILSDTRDDFIQVRNESQILDQGMMMINQTLERVLNVLRKSPALAARLSEPDGLDFDHLTLGKAKVGLALESSGVVTLKIRVGKVKKIW